MAFTLPVLFLFADPGAKPYSRVKSSWIGGVEDSFVLLFGSALGRVVFCCLWLVTVAVFFYFMEIRRPARLEDDRRGAQPQSGSPFQGRLRNRPSRTKKKDQNHHA